MTQPPAYLELLRAAGYGQDLDALMWRAVAAVMAGDDAEASYAKELLSRYPKPAAPVMWVLRTFLDCASAPAPDTILQRLWGFQSRGEALRQAVMRAWPSSGMHDLVEHLGGENEVFIIRQGSLTLGMAVHGLYTRKAEDIHGTEGKRSLAVVAPLLRWALSEGFGVLWDNDAVHYWVLGQQDLDCVPRRRHKDGMRSLVFRIRPGLDPEFEARHGAAVRRACAHYEISSADYDFGFDEVWP